MTNPDQIHSLGYITKIIDAELCVDAEEIVAWIKSRPSRIAYVMGEMQGHPSCHHMLALFDTMDGLERDEFIRQLLTTQSTTRLTKEMK